MRLLLANYRYHVSGGPERYMFNVTDALTARGHEVIPFSIHYTRNQPTPYARYFVEPLGSRDEVMFRDQRFGLRTLWRTLLRLFYAPDVERAVTRLVDETQPQVAFVLHYLRKLSPSLLVGLKKAGLPIVVRLSDYAMLCPASICWRDGHSCELCVRGDILPSIRYRCVKGSLVASGLNALATWYHRKKRYFDLIDVFITPTRFMHQMMVAAGFPESRLKVIPTFVDSQVFHPATQDSKHKHFYVAYVGRLDYDKGAHILLDAWQEFKRIRPNCQIKLKIAGSGDGGYFSHLKSMSSNDVMFLGKMDKSSIVELLGDAYLSVIPSLWHDNLPNVLLESYASGTPVIASNTGSLKESVVEGKTGFLFDPGNSKRLSETIMFCLDNPEQVSLMSKNAQEVAKTKYSPERHLNELESLFLDLA